MRTMAIIANWMLVLIVAIVSWMAVDILLPMLFNVFILSSEYLRLAPVVEFFIAPRPLGNHIIVFTSYFTAVLAGALIATGKNRIKAAMTVGVIFGLIRVAEAIANYPDTKYTEDTLTQYIIGSIAAIAGLVVGIAYVRRVEKE